MSYFSIDIHLVVIFSFSLYPDEEDAKSVLLNMSVRRFMFTVSPYSFSIEDSPVFCMQIIRPENLRHLAVDDSKELVIHSKWFLLF